MTDLTPNLKLEKVPANTKTWADRMNENMILIDAAIGAYFTLQNLQGIWENSHAYTAGQTVVDGVTAAVWTTQTDHISAGIPTTFAEERATNPTLWTVYSSPARARGAWTSLTSYAVNDFVVSGAQYAVCIASHTSTTSFENDVASGYWSILVDLSEVGDAVLPVPGGGGDANKFVVTTPTGNGYTIADVTTVLALLGTTTVGKAVLTASSEAAARAAINAQVAGSYQTASANLSTLAAATLASFGVNLLALANAAALRSAAGLGTAATRNTGTTVNTIPLLDGSGDIPASMIPAIDLTSMVTGVLPAANGGYVAPRGYYLANNTGWSLSSSFSTPFVITEGTQIFSQSYTAENGMTVLVEVDVVGVAGQTATASAAIFIDGATNCLAQSNMQFTNVASHKGPNRVVYGYVSDGGAHTISVRIAGNVNVDRAVLIIREFLV